MEEMKKNLSDNRNEAGLGRRDLMKLGVGAGVAMAIPAGAAVAAQQGEATSAQSGAAAPARPAARPASMEPTGPLQAVPMVQQWPAIAESGEVVTSTTAGYTTHTGAGWVN